MFLINNIDHFQGHSKIFSIFCASCMVIDSFQKKSVIKCSLDNVFSRAKPFRLKKKSDFVLISKKSQVFNKRQNFKIWLQQRQIGNPACRG